MTDKLPERDTAKPAEQQGLFNKFEVRRTDGSSDPGGKHHGCEYFVLDVDHDSHAKAALSAYADSVEPTHPQLAADMRSRYGLSQAVREAVPEIDQRCSPSILSKLPPIQLTGQALKAALDMIAPDDTAEQFEQSVCIQWRDEGIDVDGHHAPAGWCAWDSEYPEEGSILIAVAKETK